MPFIHRHKLRIVNQYCLRGDTSVPSVEDVHANHAVNCLTGDLCLPVLLTSGQCDTSLDASFRLELQLEFGVGPPGDVRRLELVWLILQMTSASLALGPLSG